VSIQVHIAHADITTLPVDAVVVPANSQGVMTAGAALAIKQKGGEAIEAAAVARAPIAVGAALLSTAGSLPAKNVIHTPVTSAPGEPTTTEELRRAVRAALVAATVNRLKVIAFPGMGTGGGGIAPAESARAIIEELRAHKKAFPETAYLVDVEKSMVEAFEAALENAQHSL
jgi:O-acetyl-ADP-ribose deacetylase (regulator of RNase III)